jgi:hypothetical protein
MRDSRSMKRFANCCLPATPCDARVKDSLETSMTWEETFNRSRFSHFINGPRGRILRIAAGTAFLTVGFIFRHQPLGVLSMLWSILPLTAGLLDVCYISAALGGPFSGAIIRARYGKR